MAVRWNALRAFQLRLATDGRLVASATGMADSLPHTDWVVSAESLADGHWHRIRLVLTSTANGQRADAADTFLFSNDKHGSE